MNSLVLKPWRWVAFLLVIPGETPSSGLRRTGVLATGLPRRGAARGAALRRTPAGLFLVRRLMTAVLFDRWRVFPATGFAWVSRPLLRFLGNDPKNNAPHPGAAPVGCFAPFLTILDSFRPILSLAAVQKPDFLPFGDKIS